MKQATQKDIDTAFGKFTRARVCLNHTNRLQQWTKQINSIEDRALKVRLSHIERAHAQQLEREAAIKRRLCNNAHRLRAVKQVFRQNTMEQIANVVKGGDFEEAVNRYVDGEVNKRLDMQNRERFRKESLQRRYEQSRDEHHHLLRRFTSMDLSIKPPVLRRAVQTTDPGDRSAAHKRPTNTFSLPYLMLNPMLAASTFEDVAPSKLEDLSEEQIEELEAQRQDEFKNAINIAYNMDVRKPSTKSVHSTSKRGSHG